MIDIKLLAQNAVQFGHLTWRWCPKMQPYIWGEKNGVHLIDVSKTAFKLEEAAKFLESVAATGRPILWVGTKKAAQDVVRRIAQETKSPSVTHRWIGGTITNFSQVKKSITKLLHFEDILQKSDQQIYTKKEYGMYQKVVDRLLNNVGSIRSLTWPVGALVVVDIIKEHVAIKEARAAGVPVVALVDTNADPSLVDYVIPANDDVSRSINVILSYLAQAVERGKAAMPQRTQEEVAAESMIDQLIEQALIEDESSEEDRPRRKAAGAGARKPRIAGGVRKPAPRKAE
jgi:small subunit ribosomal protein S2